MIAQTLRTLPLRLYERVVKRRKTFRYWAELERSQWLPRAELERRQLDSLRRLLEHAHRNCPYYRREWDTLGLDPKQVSSLEDFTAWPLITPKTIRDHRMEMRATVSGLRMFSKTTGGSSGNPLEFDLSMESHERRVAATYRGYNWAGAGPGTRQLFLWGMSKSRPRWGQWKDRAFHRLYSRLVLNSFDLSREVVPEYLRQLNRYRPDAIVAYTNPLYTFAQILEEKGLTPYSPKSIVVGAEKLYPFQRELIERVFRAPVFETYGAREFMLIGAECDRHAGLHLTTENLVVEVLDDQGRPTPAGQEGNVVVTDLFNYGMPFVRYVNGDRAVAGWESCSCGRGLPLLRKVTGRTLDVIDAPDGRYIGGEYFVYVLMRRAKVERFQVVQVEPDRLEIRLVLRPGWGEADQESLVNELRVGVGPSMQIAILPVDDIPLTAAGKLRVVVRMTPAPATDLAATQASS